MNEKIKNLIDTIKENKEVTNHPYYLLSLNDTDLTMSKTISRDEILFKADVEGNISMLDFIRNTCKKAKEELHAKEAYISIETHSFMGYDASVDTGPIKIVFVGEDDNTVGLRFTSDSRKHREWIIEFMKYTEFGKERLRNPENIHEYMELDEFLNQLEYGIDFSEDQHQQSQENEGVQK